MGITGKFIIMTKEIYQDTYYEIITEEGITNKFQAKNGVEQGCLVSSALFNIYVNDIEETIRKGNEGETAIGTVSSGVRSFVSVTLIILYY